MLRLRLLAAAFSIAALPACAVSPARPSFAPPAPSARAATLLGTKIKHVVIIIQENRSFENLFAGFPGADAPTVGNLPGGGTTPLTPYGFTIPQGEGPPHSWYEAMEEWDNGAMDGWEITPAYPLGLYRYVPRREVRPYWMMAQQYVLADHMFPTEFGPSFTSHLDLIAGTTNLTPSSAIVDIPHHTDRENGWGCRAPAGANTYVLESNRTILPNGPYPCYDQFRTMADTLDAAGVTWHFYAPKIGASGGIWSEFQAIKNVYNGPDWQNDVISPQTRVLVDGMHGDLPSVSWVTPDGVDSDHAAAHSNRGPSWVASVVNAVGHGKDWNSTAIFVVWDDWGGWYDNVSPPQRSFEGLGIRVPCIIISPYAKKGYVSHTVYEFGSLLHFIEDTFGLPRLGRLEDGYTDGRAASPVDAFDFTQTPRKFVTIPAPYPQHYFLTSPPSGIAPDDDLEPQ